VSTSRGRRPGRPPARLQSPSRLQAWLDQNGFTSADLEADTGISRQSMTKIRAGADVRRRTMMRILVGCTTLARRKVSMEEIFDLDPESPANQA
jgi:DNA-binding Xre family transcriptional regulator